jgi:hypothetical protein
MSSHFGFVVDKVALGQVFSEYFGFSWQFLFHLLLHIHHHLSSGAGTIGQLVADVLSGLSLTPPQETKKLRYSFRECNAVWSARCSPCFGVMFCFQLHCRTRVENIRGGRAWVETTSEPIGPWINSSVCLRYIARIERWPITASETSMDDAGRRGEIPSLLFFIWHVSPESQATRRHIQIHRSQNLTILEVLTAICMNIRIFWDVKQCNKFKSSDFSEDYISFIFRVEE